MLALTVEGQRQVVQARRRFRMRRPQRLLPDLQCPPEEGFRLRVFPLVVKEQRQVVQALRRIRMLRPQRFPPDLQRPPVERLRLRVLPLVVEKPRQVVQARRRIRMRRPQRLLQDPQSPPEERLSGGIAGLAIQVDPGLVQQPARRLGGETPPFDVAGADQSVRQDALAEGPVGELGVREGGVDRCHGALRPAPAVGIAHAGADHLLEHAVHLVGAGLEVTLNQRVARRDRQQFIEEEGCLLRAGQGGGERLPQVGRAFHQDLVGDRLRGQEGAQAEQVRGGLRLPLHLLEVDGPRLRHAGVGRTDLRRGGFQLRQRPAPVGGQVVAEGSALRGEVGRGLFQGQREIAHFAGERLGGVALGGIGGRPAGAVEEEGDRLRGGQHRHVLGVRHAQAGEVVGARGDQDVPAGGGRQVAVQQRRVVGVVEDEEVAVGASQPALHGVADLLRGLAGQAEAAGGLGVGAVQGDLGIGRRPEQDVVVAGVSVAVLDGGLGLPDAAEAADGAGLGKAGDGAAREAVVQAFQEGVAAGEEGVAPVGEGCEGVCAFAGGGVRGQRVTQRSEELVEPGLQGIRVGAVYAAEQAQPRGHLARLGVEADDAVLHPATVEDLPHAEFVEAELALQVAGRDDGDGEAALAGASLHLIEERQVGREVARVYGNRVLVRFQLAEQSARERKVGFLAPVTDEGIVLRFGSHGHLSPPRTGCRLARVWQPPAGRANTGFHARQRSPAG